MMKVAVTGNVASGKTSLSRIWAREGVPLLLADELAREVVEPGSPGLAAVVKAFGSGVLQEDGTMDRGGVRKLVFDDPEKRELLEGILHPLIQTARRSWVEEQEGSGQKLCVAEIPLLFEVGMEGEFDLVVLVDAPVQERLRRLVEERGMEREGAQRMMEAQMPPEEKRNRADFLIQNDGSLEELEIQALALLDLLRARSSGRKSL